MKTIIQAKNASDPVGPYSQGTVFGDLIFLSGQIALIPENNEVISQEIGLQTRQVMENIKALLENENSSLDQVLFTTLYLKNLDDFNEVNEVYKTFFNDTPPARATVEVSRLPRDVKIEISVIAHK